MKEKELLISLSDDQWPYEYIDHDRTVARAIVYDEEENFYFIRAHRNDIFGDVTIIETSGGGVESGEDLTATIVNINNYFLCKVISFGEKSLTTDEIECFHLSTLKLSYQQAIDEYNNKATSKLGKLLYNREMPILLKAKEIIEKNKVS